MDRSYDFKAIEERWKQKWVDAKMWSAEDDPDPAKKRYLVTMFPYPSGDLHMGHVEIFSIQDAIARFYRMRGYQVLNPIGWDAFGLPAENAAIKRNIHPKKWTYDNIAKHRASMERLGYSFDWERVFYTCEPSYYRWNQWIFARLYEKGLAYRRAAPANWCPNDKTVLANEQVIAGRCERCDTPVVKRNLTQWFFKITDYADRLIDDLELNTGWNERLKMMQRNWIGRSSGAEVEFEIEGRDEPITVYTTRPDTLWGATFFVVAPEHPLAEELVAATEHEAALKDFKDEVGRMTDIDRTATDRPKRGMFLHKHAVNPVNGENMPIWVADYVLMDYGTGAIMAVPAHDQRDFEFARQYGLEIRPVIRPPGDSAGVPPEEAYAGEGVMVNSGPFDGTPTSESVQRVVAWLEEKDLGRPAVNFRLRDWLISRQRYWGTPIPVIFCEDCGEVLVPDDQLPVELPDDVDFQPTGEASPLATAKDWVSAPCPKCGKPGRRETDTMDTFVDSSWYFHRYLDPRNEEIPFDRTRSDAWMPMDQYTGGITHAVMHLIYARFFQKVFVDMGMARDPEPFPRLLNQGMVTMGGKVMSKSRGNIVEPREAFELYGADALRLYMLFSGPPEQDFDWPQEGVAAIGRVSSPWLQRVWRLCEENRDVVSVGALAMSPLDVQVRRHIHRTIKVVTQDFEAFSFNTAIARLQELVNQAYRYRKVGGGHPQVLRELIEALLKMLAPFAPYLTEEQWHRLGHEGSIHLEAWPSFDPDLAEEDRVTMVVQINGKVRDTIDVEVEITEEEMRARALASEKVRGYLDGKEPTKVITRPPKLISFVVPS
ncbi:MAG: leucine--tRNA ligase [Actinomycetota bacterium]|nr:leucine--tRNA ligase [Actinomycetota bacterium]